MYEKLRNRRVTHLLMAPCGQRNDGLRGQSTFFRLKINTTNRTSTTECGCGGLHLYRQRLKDFAKFFLDKKKTLQDCFYSKKKTLQDCFQRNTDTKK